MARGGERIPEPLLKREILYAPDPDPAALAAHGRAFLEAGRVSEACDFFERARDSEGLQKVLAQSRDEADYFLFDRCCLALGLEVPADDWAALGDRAQALGKDRFAYQFRLRAGLEVAPPLVEPVTPPPQGALLESPPEPEPDPDSPPAEGPFVDSSGR